MPPKPPEPIDGELSGYMAEAQGSEEVKDFMKTFMEMNFSGEFDAASLAQSAPESLQTYAQEQGVDLETMLQNAHEQHQEMASGKGKGGGGMPPPPRDENESNNVNSLLSQYTSVSQLNNSESSLLEDLMSSISIKAVA